jgi:CBS domain-containing protein
LTQVNAFPTSRQLTVWQAFDREAARMTNRQMGEIVRNQRPVTLPPSKTVQQACRSMHDMKVGAVLVTDAQGKLVGIFTGRDAVRAVAEGVDPTVTQLKAVMTAGPHCMPPGRTAIEALRLMRDGGFRHVPVVDGDQLIGVVSRGDFRGLEQDRMDEETGIWERI